MSKSPTIFDRLPGGPVRCGRKFFGGLLALLIMLWPAGFASAQSEIEFKVKAAFLFNFARFTEWPTAKLGSADSFVIGCFSDSEFIDVLESTVTGRTVGSRPITIKRLTGADDLRACHMLFVGRININNAKALLARAKGMHVLTVGEGYEFTDRGGMIGFVPEDGSVKFTINQKLAEQAGLKMSSKLVGLAINERRGKE